MQNAMSKTAISEEIAGSTGLMKKQVSSVFDELSVLIERHIKMGAVQPSGAHENRGQAQARNQGSKGIACVLLNMFRAPFSCIHHKHERGSLWNRHRVGRRYNKGNEE
jgi:hypothetical protein